MDPLRRRRWDALGWGWTQISAWAGPLPGFRRDHSRQNEAPERVQRRRISFYDAMSYSEGREAERLEPPLNGRGC